MTNLFLLLGTTTGAIAFFIINSSELGELNLFRNVINNTGNVVVPPPQTINPININVTLPAVPGITTTTTTTTTTILTLAGFAGIVIVYYTLPGAIDWATLPHLFTQATNVVNNANNGLEIVTTHLNLTNETLTNNVLINNQDAVRVMVERLDTIINRPQVFNTIPIDHVNLNIEGINEQLRMLNRLNDYNLSVTGKGQSPTDVTTQWRK